MDPGAFFQKRKIVNKYVLLPTRVELVISGFHDQKPLTLKYETGALTNWATEACIKFNVCCDSIITIYMFICL